MIFEIEAAGRARIATGYVQDSFCSGRKILHKNEMVDGWGGNQEIIVDYDILIGLRLSRAWKRMEPTIRSRPKKVAGSSC